MGISRALRNHKSPTPERTLAAFLELALSNVLTYICSTRLAPAFVQLSPIAYAILHPLLDFRSSRPIIMPASTISSSAGSVVKPQPGKCSCLSTDDCSCCCIPCTVM
ncbi:hypothetical protein B5807_09845 [Epicoccum nigrum]|uniref:Uncharacterized protein n=1 Tax=Epicoccum nigrum TaxID=105696 RepID=A0A1Y2LUH1_EPING|nr:hypothetical protein B5807_09845 [Epicoccum nigrum]